MWFPKNYDTGLTASDTYHDTCVFEIYIDFLNYQFIMIFKKKDETKNNL